MEPVIDNGVAGFYGSDQYTQYASAFDAEPVGYASDGTFGTPMTAQPVNSPQNQAGYSSSISPTVAAILNNGIGVLGRLGMTSMQVDYMKAEATNGGLYRQGVYAGIPRYGVAGQQMNLSVLLLIAGLAYLILKD